MAYLWMFIVGIVVGWLARWIMPGEDKMGLLMTGVLGVAGSFVGGFLGRLVTGNTGGSMLQPAGLIMSVVGALLLLFAWNRLRR